MHVLETGPLEHTGTFFCVDICRFGLPVRIKNFLQFSLTYRATPGSKCIVSSPLASPQPQHHYLPLLHLEAEWVQGKEERPKRAPFFPPAVPCHSWHPECSHPPQQPKYSSAYLFPSYSHISPRLSCQARLHFLHFCMPGHWCSHRSETRKNKWNQWHP